MSFKDSIDVIKAVGPSEQHRHDIRQSWVGTLIGQATVAVLLVVGYLAALGFGL